MPAKQFRKGKRPDNRPARKRYWAKGQLRKNKIRNMVANGWEQEKAERVWDATRTRRMK